LETDGLRKKSLEKIFIEADSDTSALFGSHDRHIKRIEKAFQVRVHARGEALFLEGAHKPVQKATQVFREMMALTKLRNRPTADDLEYAIRLAHEDDENKSTNVRSAAALDAASREGIPVLGGKRVIIPKSPAQQRYLEYISKNDIVVGIGPAGTGKTYLAMAMAVSAFQKREVKRIILARPAVEAGERLGFLPGDLAEKINPYLRPLYDALYDMMTMAQAARLIERGDIEIAPLAFMRGRTLNEAFIVLDEAQNATSEQMKMFLTRLGERSRAVVTGDVTQVDLSTAQTSGLVEIQRILEHVPGIRFAYFSDQDVVRHPLVQKIVRAYARYEQQKESP